jgi:hypothetical protein
MAGIHDATGAVNDAQTRVDRASAELQQAQANQAAATAAGSSAPNSNSFFKSWLLQNPRYKVLTIA